MHTRNKNSFVIYLMECRLCEKSQYVEYSLNLRTNTHRNEVWRTEGPPCDMHFQMPGHNFLSLLLVMELRERKWTI